MVNNKPAPALMTWGLDVMFCSHVAPLTGSSPAQHFRRQPLPHLPVLPFPRGGRLRCPPIGRAQPPQLRRQISTDQHAAGAHVAMDAALTVQVLLDVQVKTGEG